VRKPARLELRHELLESKLSKAISVDRYPVVNKVVLEAAKDLGNLQIVFNPSFRVHEVILAVVFEILDRFWSDISVGEMRGTGDNRMGASGIFLVGHTENR
jgi:hypothetical protein